MDRARVIDGLRAVFATHAAPVDCAYLFGSHARGQASPTSDIDVAVLFRESPPSGLQGLGFDLAGEIERSLGRQVDIVVLNRAAPDLVHRVLRDGVLVHEADRRRRVDFETRSRAEYFDVLPHLRRYRRSVQGQGA
jgi:predicted nucleotidyltransferase